MPLCLIFCIECKKIKTYVSGLILKIVLFFQELLVYCRPHVDSESNRNHKIRTADVNGKITHAIKTKITHI